MRDFDDCLVEIHGAARINRCQDNAAEIAAAAEIYKMEILLNKLAPIIDYFVSTKNESENSEDEDVEDDFNVTLY